MAFVAPSGSYKNMESSLNPLKGGNHPQNYPKAPAKVRIRNEWGERWDLNPQPLGPQPRALTN